ILKGLMDVLILFNNVHLKFSSPLFEKEIESSWYFGRSKLKNFHIFEMNREKHQKNEGKTGFFTQNQQLKFSIFLIVLKVIKKKSEIFEFIRNMSKLRKFAIQISTKIVKIMNICKLFCSSKFIKLFIFISNVKYFRLTNHLRSESFFVYNDTYHGNSNLTYPSPRSTPPPNVQQSITKYWKFNTRFSIILAYNKYKKKLSFKITCRKNLKHTLRMLYMHMLSQTTIIKKYFNKFGKSHDNNPLLRKHSTLFRYKFQYHIVVHRPINKPQNMKCSFYDELETTLNSIRKYPVDYLKRSKFYSRICRLEKSNY
ncbi:hypothetical protein AGLY_006295, partial [Aphis glycines]